MIKNGPGGFFSRLKHLAEEPTSTMLFVKQFHHVDGIRDPNQRVLIVILWVFAQIRLVVGPTQFNEILNTGGRYIRVFQLDMASAPQRYSSVKR